MTWSTATAVPGIKIRNVGSSSPYHFLYSPWTGFPLLEAGQDGRVQPVGRQATSYRPTWICEPKADSLWIKYIDDASTDSHYIGESFCAWVFSVWLTDALARFYIAPRIRIVAARCAACVARLLKKSR